MTGVWNFVPQKSRIRGPVPIRWVQIIGVREDRLSLSEEIIRADGTGLSYSINANVDGRDFPVIGSPTIDSMAYTRPGPFTIQGTGKKAGVVVLNETIDFKGDTLTITYSYRHPSGDFMTNVAVFSREPERTG
jgi:hypothetical protein